MRSSNDRRLGLLAFGAALLIPLFAEGCAHAPRRPEPAVAEPDHERPAPPTRRANLPPDGAPEPSAEPPAPPGRLDPSEEITPEELATLPDPVPRSGDAPQAPRAPQGVSSSESRVELPEAATDASQGRNEAPGTAREGLWRVQIHASESRAEAGRVGRAAARRLGARLFVEREGRLYKVRLGGFASEADAQALRDRAVRAGYPGAFRTRARP